MPADDRLRLLLGQHRVTGIDFVYVAENQVDLYVHFLTDPTALERADGTPVPLTDLTPDRIHIQSRSERASLPEVALASAVWEEPTPGAHRLHLVTASPGDFSQYELWIDDPRVDRFFNRVGFSFKANCPSDLDCKPGPHRCPPEADVDYPVDYGARDFWSFRRALLDMAAQRYPDWQDRLEADAGVMLAEAMSALGDELAYMQDRVAREAHLETASQRRSLRRHARLVDYEPDEGQAAHTWLDFELLPGHSLSLPPGAAVWAESDDGKRITFEVGTGLFDEAVGYPVRGNWNRFEPHIWDQRAVCLPVGSTELYIQGHHASSLLPGPGHKWLLLSTVPSSPERPSRRQMVRVVEAVDDEDPVLLAPVTRLRWTPDTATRHELDLDVLHLRGNVVPAVAGARREAYFSIGAAPTAAGGLQITEAVERLGANGSTQYLFSLPESEHDPLCFRRGEGTRAVPDIRLFEQSGTAPALVDDEEWSYRRSLLGSPSSLPEDRHFTLDDGVYREVVRYERVPEPLVHRDYKSGEGFTLRFGDGDLGRVPSATRGAVQGAIFRVEYCLGNGRCANVAADTLTELERDGAGVPLLGAALVSVKNPFAVDSGIDRESNAQIRTLAPEAFRAVTHRAVRPEDYAEALQRLPWVQRAGASFRWTGSWLTAFATPDPMGQSTLGADDRSEAERQLDRFRQAGRQTHVLDPRFAFLDLELVVCVAPDAYPGQVEARVLTALFGDGAGSRGFFHPDHFSFGTPLERSALEAAVQHVHGVRAVEGIQLRRRHFFEWRPFEEAAYRPALNEVLAVENDPRYPERGSLSLTLRGGA